MMLTAQIESFTYGIPELKPLLPGHYEELSQHFKHKIPLDVDWNKYLHKDSMGEVLYVTLRDAGALVGYFVGFIGPGLHYKSCITLHLDVIYVVPEARGDKGGIVLMKTIAKEFNRRGALLWTMGVKEEHRFWMEDMLLACGFEPFERHFAFWSDKGVG